MFPSDRYWQAKKVTLIGALLNFLLGIFKLIGGIVFYSHALLADAAHSFSDLLTDILVIIASKYGSQDADDSHPYGHQRIETAATLLLSLLLLFAGGGIAWEGFQEIIHRTDIIPELSAIPVAVLSILTNEAIFQYTQRIGKRIQSDLIISNAWHHRSDAGASLVVLIGLIGSVNGYPYLDAIAAIIVALTIIHMGWQYGKKSLNELIDTAVDHRLLAQIEQVIYQVDGVKKMHQLRTRLMAGAVFVDVHVQVSPFLSVSEGHFIAQQVHYVLLKTIPCIKDVTVHIDPEDDEINTPSIQLPVRSVLEQDFLKPWQCDYPDIQSWTLHYLNGQITVDLVCEHASNALRARIDSDLRHQKYPITVRLFAVISPLR